MAWYRRGYRRRGRRYGSSLRRRSRGNLRAAFDQNDSSTMTIKVSTSYTFELAVGSSYAGQIDNMYNVLATSNMFNAISQLYDQIRIDAVKVKLAQSYGNNTFQNAANPATIITYWDRNGVDAQPDLAQAGSYSSAIKTTSMVGGTFNQTRYLYANSIQEKGYFVPTSRVATLGQAANAGANESVPWKPTFGIVYQSNVAALVASRVATIQAEYSIVVTFRGMRRIA